MSGHPELPSIPPGFRAVSSNLMADEEPSEAEVEARRKRGIPDELTVVTWNVEWAPPRKRDAIRERLASLDPDVIVLTEGDRGVLPKGGRWIDGGGDWGYSSPDAERRKVILWSKHALFSPDTQGSADRAMPPGRFVAANVLTTRGAIRFVGVCIPWKDAHVRTGRKDAQPWGEHLAYLECIQPALADAYLLGDACLLGDFNQRIPRRGVPPEVHAELTKALLGFTVVTQGDVAGLGEPVVDHIAVSFGVSASGVKGIDRHEGHGSGRALSDHHLIACRIRLKKDRYG